MMKDKVPNGTNGVHLYNQEVHHVELSDRDRATGGATPEIIAEAVTYLHRDGIIVLDNAIDPSHLDALNDVLAPEADEIAKNPDHHFNFGKDTRNSERLQKISGEVERLTSITVDQAPPLIPGLMYKDVWANPMACSILQAVLGPELVCHYANGNTALKATGRQPVHSDINKPHPMFPFAMIINISLSDVTAENGATEIWPGSHRDSCIDQHTSQSGEAGLTIKPALVEERRKHSPPIQPATRKGSLVIRDVRLWHAGRPNRTDTPRIMLAYVVQPKWFQAPSTVLLPLKAKGIVDGWRSETGVEYAAQWVDGDVDHKKIKSDDVDFATTNRKMLEMEELMHPPPP